MRRPNSEATPAGSAAKAVSAAMMAVVVAASLRRLASKRPSRWMRPKNWQAPKPLLLFVRGPDSELLEVLALCTCTQPMRLIADRCILAVACVTDGAVVVVPLQRLVLRRSWVHAPRVRSRVPLAEADR